MKTQNLAERQKLKCDVRIISNKAQGTRAGRLLSEAVSGWRLANGAGWCAMPRTALVGVRWRVDSVWYDWVAFTKIIKIQNSQRLTFFSRSEKAMADAQ